MSDERGSYHDNLNLLFFILTTFTLLFYLKIQIYRYTTISVLNTSHAKAHEKKI